MLDHVTDEGIAVPILPLTRGHFTEWLKDQTAEVRGWIGATGFSADPGAACLLPDAAGNCARVIFGVDEADPWCWAHLPAKLPKGLFRIEAELERKQSNWVAMAFELACYQFTRYQERKTKAWPRLVWPAAADRDQVTRTVEAVFLVRDLVNTPACDMGPEELAQVAAALAEQKGARVRTIVGNALLEENYPLIHAVGRASTRLPRLIDLRWGDDPAAPKVTLVGKGVCFDTGGLDLKNSSGMKLMKKDMGGAAHVLGLAAMIMDAKLPVRLRVLIPAVENAVSGNAFRPLDVLRTRKGITVEVGNTDAEGRLVLADALSEANSEHPDLLIDLATLTGAARTALGPELPALFTPNEALAESFLAAAAAEDDPLWRLPLWKPYRRLIESKVADLSSASDSPFAGAITAALFLQEFVAAKTDWAHLDIYAWNPTARPGRPEGGEATALRALFRVVSDRYPII